MHLLLARFKKIDRDISQWGKIADPHGRIYGSRLALIAVLGSARKQVGKILTLVNLVKALDTVSTRGVHALLDVISRERFLSSIKSRGKAGAQGCLGSMASLRFRGLGLSIS